MNMPKKQFKKYVINPDYLYIEEIFFIREEEEFFVEESSSVIEKKWCFDSIDEAKNRFLKIIQSRIDDLNFSITQYEFLQYRVKNSIDPSYLKDLIKKYLQSVELLLKNTLGIDNE